MTIKELSLIDEIMPDSDVAATYSILIQAPPDKVYKMLEGGIPVGSITKLLMGLRGIPRFFRKRNAPLPQDPFYRLKQLQDREIVLGIAGQFWKPVSKIVPIHSLQEFLDFQQDGYCKAAMNMKIVEKAPRQSLLSTETRVLCYGSAKKHFKGYWRLIGPFSGLIRLEMLRKIRKNVESAPQTHKEPKE
jgi:hypothetical protein